MCLQEEDHRGKMLLSSQQGTKEMLLSLVTCMKKFLRFPPNLSTLRTLERGCCKQSILRRESHYLRKCELNPHCVQKEALGYGAEGAFMRPPACLAQEKALSFYSNGGSCWFEAWKI